MTEWFARWFGEAYVELYPHRNDDDARQVLTLINRVIDLSGARVLDLACGQGRHAIQLNALGANTVGVDLSRVLLDRARGADDGLQLVRGDMRVLPFRASVFDVVVNLFTSFGYFPDDGEHQAVLCSVGELIAHGGWFVMDFLNAEYVRHHLVPRERQVLGGTVVEIERRLVDDGKYVEKEIYLTDDDERHVERVRLFSAEDLADMLSVAQLDVSERFGDYEGGPLGADAPRAVLFARRS